MPGARGTCTAFQLAGAAGLDPHSAFKIDSEESPRNNSLLQTVTRRPMTRGTWNFAAHGEPYPAALLNAAHEDGSKYPPVSTNSS